MRRAACDVLAVADPLNDPRLIAGLITGLLVGMTGMGGGALMTPLLIFLFNFNPATAIGTDILHGAIFKSFGAVRHRRLGTVRARLAGWMLVGSAPSSLLRVWTATYLMLRRQRRLGAGPGARLHAPVRARVRRQGARASERAGGEPRARLTTRDRIVAVSIGTLAGGFIVGLTSVGSGTLFALAMLLAFPLAAKFVVGTDIAHAAALLWVAGIGHLVAGNVDVPIAWLLVGSIQASSSKPDQRRAPGNRPPLLPRGRARAQWPQAPRRAVRERARDRLSRHGPGGPGRVGREPDRPAHAAGAEEVAAYASSALTEPSASGATPTYAQLPRCSRVTRPAEAAPSGGG